MLRGEGVEGKFGRDGTVINESDKTPINESGRVLGKWACAREMKLL